MLPTQAATVSLQVKSTLSNIPLCMITPTALMAASYSKSYATPCCNSASIDQHKLQLHNKRCA